MRYESIYVHHTFTSMYYFYDIDYIEKKNASYIYYNIILMYFQEDNLVSLKVFSIITELIQMPKVLII